MLSHRSSHLVQDSQVGVQAVDRAVFQQKTEVVTPGVYLQAAAVGHQRDAVAAYFCVIAAFK